MIVNYTTNSEIQSVVKALRSKYSLRSDSEAVRLAIALSAALVGMPTPAHTVAQGRPQKQTANDRRKLFDIMQLPLPLRLEFVPWLNEGVRPTNSALEQALAAGADPEVLWRVFGGAQ